MATNSEATILYIEDDIASRLLVQRVLGSRGYDVHVAGNGLDGIALARDKEPQLILMDINLPDMDGREITTRLRGLPNFSEVPIVALTANISAGSREMALAAGCTGFLTKPINVSEFPQQVKDFLQGRVEPLSPSERNIHLQKHAQNLVERLENKIRELEGANKRLRELDKMKSDFIVLVSHELRTPLTLISGYAHLLEEQLKQTNDQTVPAETVKSIAEGLNLGVTRMREVVNEIISVSRIASGTLELAIGPVRLQQIMEDLRQDLDEVCRRRRLTLEIGDLHNLPVIEGDGKRIRVALENVMGNAIKFTPDGGSIFVVGRKVGDAVDLIIRDTGIGIPVKEQRRIFDQFYVLGSIQHHSTSKSAFQGGGLGLGLAIAHGIVEAHNGRIWVESKRRDLENPPGSTFHILLPIRQASQQTIL
ncbi:MAG: hybrid sensor histidine kinase/response regulator [Ardenticatenaceae bacterium]|nr:hybrid sensor histidine kinase/response regulator [Anaerolineales bacterium]MCB8923513.1 hybrid sensor histidine kinase/response regulator [Ardenticatenaceae bacterium]MCB9003762.1 hybrid sensor histidine kinase/response regulator [Ardenticatenaceae bacterium]